MKRMIYLASIAAVVALTGCASDRTGRGGTYDDDDEVGDDDDEPYPAHYNQGRDSKGQYYYDGTWHNSPPPPTR